MRIDADAGRCVGAGQCVLSAPEIFDQDDNAIVVVVADAPGESARVVAAQAADRCPSGAITVHD